MKMIRAQYNKLNGPDATCSFKLEFTIDESQSECLMQLLKLRKGTEVLISIDQLADVDPYELETETNEQTRSRLNKRMHAIIGDIAGAKCVPTAQIKQTLKDMLVKKDLLKESTSELDIKGLAMSIYLLENEFNV